MCSILWNHDFLLHAVHELLTEYTTTELSCGGGGSGGGGGGGGGSDFAP